MSTSPSLSTLGGKAANLIRLREAGLPVPEFVVLTTAEYAAFVAEHDLGATIAEALTKPAAEASDLIRAAFRRPIGAEQRARLLAAIEPLLDRPLAVRSSATAEDLPDASFAGQQDTFLDVRGDEAVLDAVVECWSSLWTERAITYRARNAVPYDGLGLAVVVQELVDAEASGVLFTADPLTGHRGRTVIDAVQGLGEKLVSGQVVPDHVEVDTASGRIVERTVSDAASPTLTDAQALALTRLGSTIAALDGQPQDIEWTRTGDVLQIVQSRPITSLYPLPTTQDAGDDEVLWLSFGSFQGMLEPITPLGQDALRRMLAGAALMFGRTVDHRTNPYLRPAGERLWARWDHIQRNVPEAVHRLLPIGDPAAASVVERLSSEPAFAPRKGGRRRAARALAPFVAQVLPRAAAAMVDPDATRARLARTTDAYVADLERRLAVAAAVSRPEQRLRARVHALEDVLRAAFGVLLPGFAPIMMPSVLMMGRLKTLAAETGLPDADALAMGVLRSLPGNVTTEMDLALFAAARAIHDDAAARAHLMAGDPAELAASYLAGTLPATAQRALTEFLDRYGMRGVAEIDLGTPRWRDQPEGLLRTIIGYLDLTGDSAPDAAYERGRLEAEAAIERLAAALPAPKARQVRFLAGRLRRLFGARETPKFTIIRAFGLAREALLASGADLVAAGVLERADDVVFLTLDELRVAFRGDLRSAVAERRASRDRELRRTRVPLVLVGDGRTFYSGFADAAGADFAGMGVSPGVVEGLVRVVHDPRTSGLLPGEILVCRGTDPAWTPLFLTAAGLVTEVGGLMTHGSVVAREYGLPAVVGVSGATVDLATGQRIRLDGSAGTITLLELSEG